MIFLSKPFVMREFEQGPDAESFTFRVKVRAKRSPPFSLFWATVYLYIMLLDTPVKRLNKRSQKWKIASFAPTTLRTRHSQWRQVQEFRKKFATALKPLPATPNNICRYIAYVAPGREFSTAKSSVGLFIIPPYAKSTCARPFTTFQ